MNKTSLSHTLLKEIGFTLLAEGKTLKVRADGYSMYPTIRPRSVIYIDFPGKGADFAPGEIIAWKRDSGFVVHRLISTYVADGKKFCITRGDSSLYDDDPVPFEQIAGRVTMIESPDGKTVQAAILKNKKPNYRCNRFLLRIILQFSRLKRLF